MSDPTKYVSIPEAARLLNVSEATVRNYIGRGYFPVYKIGGQRGVVVDAAEAQRAMRLVPRSKARRNYGKYGPKARVIVRPEVVSP